jgi:carbon monoxide dehydrogenase subunit G
MLMKLTERLQLDAPPEDVWSLLRDTPRFAGLLPGVESVAPIEDGTEAYAARVSDKIGPFKVTMNLQVRIAEAREPSLLKANLGGADANGINRVTGSIQAALAPLGSGTQMDFEASVEVLGKLATLGAVAIRRRTGPPFTPVSPIAINPCRIAGSLT